MSIETLADVKVGTQLILTSRNTFRGDESVIVTRIGTKYLYVAFPGGAERPEAYNRQTGIEAHQAGVAGRLFTQSQYEDRAHRASLVAGLRGAGIEVRAEFPTDTLRALLAIVQGEKRDGS